MGRPKYRITPADASFARRWVEGKLGNPAWLGASRSFEAHEDLGAREESAAGLNDWCEAWLDAAQWLQMKNAVRAARRRARVGDDVSVTLSRKAWGLLSFWAEKDDCTLSEAIEKRMSGNTERQRLPGTDSGL